ncbi:hypothetical protein QBC46DRAFT_97370 [Diplogelasinospora grovesii]|uniref:CST complex subunit STN1 n=1 Tax=Diplogelasinospora grovesii TaxID=303347 RepID=A0AAN6NB87_9PEZI|nr:hypothetical protein QBC46DRAFT_97370 [Diplogelasinospora grovesii]
MTSAEEPPDVYPQYCFHLSPTISRWCHFQAADIHALSSHPGFEGQDVYFHINHPVKWVRIAGVVVAVDEWATHRVYTVDDSSGATIECVVWIPSQPAAAFGQATVVDLKGGQQDGKLPVIDSDLDVGHIIDVKGMVMVFRGTKQIKAEKIVHLRSTEQEVQFWEKIVQLRSDVLSKPWVLDKREVRKCRREAEGLHDDRSRVKRYKSSSTTADTAEATRSHTGKERQPAEKVPSVARRPKITGLERRVRPSTAATAATIPLPIRGKYSALGL